MSAISRRWLPILLAAAFSLPVQATAQIGSTTAAAARIFISRAERELNELSIRSNQASWIAANFITEDSEALSAEHARNFSVAIQKYAVEAKKYDKTKLPAELRRKMTLLKLALVAPPPGNPTDATELTKITTSMEADYGKGSYCRTSRTGASECRQINELSKVLATSTDPSELLDAWQGWHKVGAPLRQRYSRFVELSNKGARELGFDNTGDLWRAGYDMTPAEFSAELDRLWLQVQPLYQSLHAYVRTRLG